MAKLAAICVIVWHEMMMHGHQQIRLVRYAVWLKRLSQPFTLSLFHCCWLILILVALSLSTGLLLHLANSLLLHFRIAMRFFLSSRFHLFILVVCDRECVYLLFPLSNLHLTYHRILFGVFGLHRPFSLGLLPTSLFPSLSLCVSFSFRMHFFFLHFICSARFFIVHYFRMRTTPSIFYTHTPIVHAHCTPHIHVELYALHYYSLLFYCLCVLLIYSRKEHISLDANTRQNNIYSV